MADTLNRLQKNAGRRLVLISARADAFQAALVERADAPYGWRVVHETAEAADLSRVLAVLPNIKGVQHTVLTTAACRILLLDQVVPENLPEQQVREMLRWEVEASVAAENSENGRTAVLPVSWETGYTRAGQQTAVAALNPSLLEEMEKILSPYGLTLAGVLPALSLGWALPGLQSTGLTEAVICHSGENCTLTVMERGKMEFFMTYALYGGALPKSLVADARSFPIKKFHHLADAGLTANVEAEIPSLPTAEKNPDNWYWYAMLQACGLLKSSVSALKLPLVVTLEAPKEVWKKPVVWWAAAAAMICLFVTPKLLEWRGQIGELEEQKAATQASIQETVEKLRVFAADAQAYDQQETELKSLNAEIEIALQEAEKPGRAPCAQVAYVKDSLAAMSEAFTDRGRVKHFKTDYHGRVYIQGDSRGDAIVLDALEHFYKLLVHHPVKQSMVSTTKEGAEPGHLLFTADDAGKPLGSSMTAATAAAPTVPAPSATPVTPPAPMASGLPVAQVPGMPAQVMRSSGPDGGPVMMNR